MRYEIHTINGLKAVVTSRKHAIEITSDLPANCSGKAVILIKERKHSYPQSGIQVQHGVLVRHTMLLYPANAKCRMYTAEEWVRECLGTREHDWSKARFTGNTTCAKCGLMPMDDEDLETPCEGVTA